MKAELGRTLREQMSWRQERERTDSNQRKLEGSREQIQWSAYNQRKDQEEKNKKIEVQRTLMNAYHSA